MGGEPDEYHDDDDPGYRIREIYEAELLAELSTNMNSSKRIAGAGDRDGAAPGDVADELASAAADGGRSSGTGPQLAWEGSKQAGSATQHGRSSSPTFGSGSRAGAGAATPDKRQ